MQPKRILQAFGTNETIRRPALLLLLSELYPNAKLTTLDWHIHSLLEQRKIVRRGRGSYALVGDQTRLSLFDLPLPNELIEITKRLGHQFALTTICVWSTSVLHSFLHQQPFITYWVVETEREAVNSVLDCLIHDAGIQGLSVPISRAEDLMRMERYSSNTSLILVVKPLISEAPVQQNSADLTVPTLEKILVDLVADSDVYSFFGEELPALFTKLDSRFMLNQDRLRRYARRRHKLPLINEYLSCLPAHHDS